MSPIIPARRALFALIASLPVLSHGQSSPRTIGFLAPWSDRSSSEVRESLVQAMLALGYAKSRLNIILRVGKSLQEELAAIQRCSLLAA